MYKKLLLIPLALVLVGLLFSLPGMVGAQEPVTGQERHELDDGIVDTPLEVDEFHHGAGATDGPRASELEPLQHTPPGHLPGSSKNVSLVGQVTISNIETGLISDVGAFGNYAYLGGWNSVNCDKGGVYVINIADPTNPKEVGFIASPPGNIVSEGVQVIRLTTPEFRGNVLVINNEICSNLLEETGEQVGGVSLWDVTNPLEPKALAIGVGDTVDSEGNPLPRANQIHSAFAWDTGNRAFVVLVDDEELEDVDILEITNPRQPEHIAEVSLQDWHDAQDELAFGEAAFLHDMVVKQIGGQWLMLLSYWDAGWIILNVDDPANPEFIDDTNYPDPDPLTGASPTEGNAHQAEWSFNSRFIIGTDEDFSPERISAFTITTGPNAGDFEGGIFGFALPLSTALEDATLNGPTVYGGYGCDANVADIPDASVLALDPGEEAIVVFERGPVEDPNNPIPACRFDEKIQNAADAGYDAAIIGNHHVGAGAGLFPDAAFCGGGDPQDIMAICIGHRALHLLFNTTPDYTVPHPLPPTNEPVPGTLGAEVSATSQFDGWGYVHLIDANTLEEVGQYIIPEALDPAFAFGFGDLTVHEVATDPRRDIAYFSYYAGGFRVAKFGPNGIQEVGHFIDQNGNNFWGVQTHQLPNGRHVVLASDRDSGLWIFKYTGP